MSRIDRLRVGAGTVAVVILGLASTPVLADECRVACTRAKQVCVDAAKQARAACKADCSAAETRRACFRLCRDDFATARSTCKNALGECRDACFGGGGGGGGDAACAEQCGSTARTCAEGVRDTALTCGSGCQDAARAATQACRTGPNPIACLLGVARDLALCLRPCVETAITDGQQCVSDLRACLAACQGGSPSGAFVP